MKEFTLLIKSLFVVCQVTTRHMYIDKWTMNVQDSFEVVKAIVTRKPSKHIITLCTHARSGVKQSVLSVTCLFSQKKIEISPHRPSKGSQTIAIVP